MPERRALRRVGTAAIVLGMVAAGAAVNAALRPDGNGMPACRVVPRAMITRVVGADLGPGKESPADGLQGSTVCNYGRALGPTVTVFAVGRDAGQFFASQRSASGARDAIDLAGDGYDAFLLEQVFGAGDPRGSPDALFLLANGQYVNVLIDGAPANAARDLAPLVAARISQGVSTSSSSSSSRPSSMSSVSLSSLVESPLPVSVMARSYPLGATVSRRQPRRRPWRRRRT